MTFLRDAHEHRGVLRQVGAVYEFRHLDLQRHLAQQPWPPGHLATWQDERPLAGRNHNDGAKTGNGGVPPPFSRMAPAALSAAVATAVPVATAGTA
ncbi:hypothetical protein [Streptomyces sp. NPDC002671]